MLQWLYTYVANFCSQCFICFFKRMLHVCLSGCCICFIHMLQVFYYDVACVYNGFKCCAGVFASVSDVCFKCFIVFRHMLQVLHFDVLKVDRVLHLLPHLLLPSLPRCPPPPSGTGWVSHMTRRPPGCWRIEHVQGSFVIIMILQLALNFIRLRHRVLLWIY